MFLIALWMTINIEHDSLKIRVQSQWLCVKRSNVQVSSYQVVSLRLPFPSLRLPGLQYSHRSRVLLEVDIAGYHVGGVECEFEPTGGNSNVKVGALDIMSMPMRADSRQMCRMSSQASLQAIPGEKSDSMKAHISWTL